MDPVHADTAVLVMHFTLLICQSFSHGTHECVKCVDLIEIVILSLGLAIIRIGTEISSLVVVRSDRAPWLWYIQTGQSVLGQ